MPDISMCMNEECPQKQQCYRYRAIPYTPNQYYCEFQFDKDSGVCENFWPIGNRKDIK